MIQTRQPASEKFTLEAAAEILTYPHPSVRLVNGVAKRPRIRCGAGRDQLNSVRTVKGGSQTLGKVSVYRPFGEVSDFWVDPAVTSETKGFIGERFEPSPDGFVCRQHHHLRLRR